MRTRSARRGRRMRARMLGVVSALVLIAVGAGTMLLRQDANATVRGWCSQVQVGVNEAQSILSPFGPETGSQPGPAAAQHAADVLESPQRILRGLANSAPNDVLGERVQLLVDDLAAARAAIAVNAASTADVLAQVTDRLAAARKACSLG
jgi:hypothetical protein